MDEIPEKDARLSDYEVQSQEVADMYHDVVKETIEDLQTRGADVGDMYRMGKEQQFKVSSDPNFSKSVADV